MKSKLVYLIVGIFLFSFISPSLVGAGQECSNQGIPTQVQDSSFDLIQFCDSCTYVNLSSMIFPNGSTINYNSAMTKTGTTYNYTFNDSSSLGTYTYSVIGDRGGALSQESLCFEITQTGKILDTSQGIVIVGLFLIILMLSVLFFYLGKNFEYLPARIFLNSLGGLFLMFTVGVAASVVQRLLTVGAVLDGIFSSLYKLMLILTSAWAIGLVLYIIYMSIRQFYSYRGLMDKFDDD